MIVHVIEQDGARRNPTYQLIIVTGLAVAALLFGTTIALVLAGWKDAGAILGLLSGVASVLVALVAGVVREVVQLRAETGQQTAVLAKIDHQTNGGLDKRIDERIEARLNEPIPYTLAPSTEDTP